MFDLSADGRYRMGVVPHDDGIAFWSQAGFEGYISITICDPVRLRTQLAEKWKMIEEHTRSQGANYQGLILQEPYPILNIPFKTDHFSIDGIIDLRYVDARAWYVDVFGRETMRFFNSDVPTDFCEMLDFLIDPHIGGNPFTMFIGKKLTEYGIQGLVYPSTRTDFTVVFENDKLRDFSGWNFIDLRPPFADIQRVNLESLPEGRHILLDSELDIDAMKSLGWMPQHDCSDRRPERKDLSYLQREDSGNFEGSLRCTGLEEAREKEYFRSMVEGQSPWTRLKRIDETQKKFCAQGN